MSLALPKSHPHANKTQIPLALLKEEPFIGLKRMYPNYGDWLLKVCRRVGLKPRIVKEADGAASALAFVAAGFGVAVVSEPLQKIPAKDVITRAQEGYAHKLRFKDLSTVRQLGHDLDCESTGGIKIKGPGAVLP